MASVRILVTASVLTMASCAGGLDGDGLRGPVGVVTPDLEEAPATATAPRRVGYFRTARGLWELEVTGAGARYSLYDLDGTPIATGVSQDAVGDLDPTFAETMQTGVARPKHSLYVENYGIGVERAGREMESLPADAATIWDAGMLER